MGSEKFITHLDLDKIEILRLSANLSFANYRELKEAFEGLQSKNHCDCVLDLSDCGYVDSAGLGLIASYVSSFRQRGGDIRLVGVASSLKETLTVTRLINFFKLYGDIDGAVRSFRLDPPPPPVL